MKLYMDIIAIIISIFSLLVAFAALHFSHLKKAKLKAIIGPQIIVYHADYEYKTSTGFIIPISFLNDSPSRGDIIRTSITIQKADKSEEAYYMQGLKFEFLNESNNQWLHECNAHPLVIPPKSGIHKNIWFMWLASNQRKLNFDKGMYLITLYMWNSQSSSPTLVAKEVLITKEIHEQLVKNKNDKSTSGVSLPIENELENNKLINNQQLERLL